MKITNTKIPDVKILEPTVYGDERGFFFTSFNQKEFESATGLTRSFIQDNHSKSSKGVLRGLHYQLEPKTQGKLVRVVQGEVFDVAVDIRKSSSTFGQWVGVNLSAENKKQLWIPEGFAHGFQTLEENTEVFYQMSEHYSPECSRGVRWNDPVFSIKWPEDEIIISDKDRQYPDFLL